MQSAEKNFAEKEQFFIQLLEQLAENISDEEQKQAILSITQYLKASPDQLPRSERLEVMKKLLPSLLPTTTIDGSLSSSERERLLVIDSVRTILPTLINELEELNARIPVKEEKETKSTPITAAAKDEGLPENSIAKTVRRPR